MSSFPKGKLLNIIVNKSTKKLLDNLIKHRKMYLSWFDMKYDVVLILLVIWILYSESYFLSANWLKSQNSQHLQHVSPSNWFTGFPPDGAGIQFLQQNFVRNFLYLLKFAKGRCDISKQMRWYYPLQFAYLDKHFTT